MVAHMDDRVIDPWWGCDSVPVQVRKPGVSHISFQPVS